MRIPVLSALALAAAALFAFEASASTSIDVTFVNPDGYRDGSFRDPTKRPQLIAEFGRYFDLLGGRYLKDGQTLEIDVLDVSFAGRYEPWLLGASDIRVMRDVDPPRFKMPYRLKQGGKVLMAGEESVMDLTYLSGPAARFSSERFGFEKTMLRRWFRARFMALQAPRT